MDKSGAGTAVMESIDALTSIASQFGPFFFAVLFMVFITKTARNWYADVVCRNPPADPTERLTYRLYFMTTFGFGLLLVVISVAWWIYIHLIDKHAFEGVIVNLQPNQVIASSESYARRVKNADMPGDLADYHFVVLSERPLTPGSKIILTYFEFDELGGVGAPPKGTPLSISVPDPAAGNRRFAIRKVDDRMTVVPIS